MSEVIYAGFWRRAVAVWIDSALIQFFASFLVLALLRLYDIPVTAIGGLKLQVIAMAAYWVVAFPYETLAHYHWGFTVGKRLMGVQVLDSRSGARVGPWQSAARTLASGLSYLPFALGYLVAAWDPRKRTFHDRVCSTVCVRMPVLTKEF
ncbi:MAG: hypothetical protein RJB38_2297 [Pseudomonadota bacterium]|jgi:uncharacterized RDD family membrane protein YckC